MTIQSPFSVRAFLRGREALLVHFNTTMQTKHQAAFPSDLQTAKNLSGPLSFCTILASDRGPWQGGHPGDANAPGSVGIIVDILESSVVTVEEQDSGSITGTGSCGNPPDPATCAHSLDARATYNEWWVRDYSAIGVFVFEPAQVFLPRYGEVPITLTEILREMPEDRIFSVKDEKFVEYNRSTDLWESRAYDEIIDPGA